MDLSDVSPWKSDNNGISSVGFVKRHEDLRASRFGLSERVCQIRHLISRHLVSVGIRKVTVRNERSQLAELRFDPHSPVGFPRPSDFNAWCSRFIRHNAAVRESKEAAHERIRSVR